MDINRDYVIDGGDMALIAKMFGWPPAVWP
jgi:hypothetical protein